MTIALVIVCIVQFVAIIVLGSMLWDERGWSHVARETDKCYTNLKMRHAEFRDAIKRLLKKDETT